MDDMGTLKSMLGQYLDSLLADGVWPEQISSDDLMDMMMMDSPAEFTGTRIVELIDWRQNR